VGGALSVCYAHRGTYRSVLPKLHSTVSTLALMASTTSLATDPFRHVAPGLRAIALIPFPRGFRPKGSKVHPLFLSRNFCALGQLSSVINSRMVLSLSSHFDLGKRFIASSLKFLVWAVCGQRYVFNPVLADNDLDPRAPCPLGIESTPVAGGPQLTPAIAIQSDLMAYQGDDPIARELKKNFRAVPDGQRIKLQTGTERHTKPVEFAPVQQMHLYSPQF